MDVVDLGGDRRGAAGPLKMIHETCPEKTAKGIENPRCAAQALPIAVDLLCRAFDDLHAIRRNDIRQERCRRGPSDGQRNDRHVEFASRAWS